MSIRDTSSLHFDESTTKRKPFTSISGRRIEISKKKKINNSNEKLKIKLHHPSEERSDEPKATDAVRNLPRESSSV